MKEKKDYLPLIFCLLLFFWTLVPLITGAFGVMDDYNYYSRLHLDTAFHHAHASATRQGRFHQLFMIPIFNQWLPYALNDLFIASAINLLLIGIDLILLAVFLKKLVSSENDRGIFYFVLIFLLITLNIHGHYSPLTSYPINFSFSLLILLLSYLFLLQHFETGKKWLYSLSVGCYLFALVFSELYILYLPILLLLTWKSTDNFKKIWNHPAVPYLIGVFCYLVVYFCWKIYTHDATARHYPGNRLADDLSLSKIGETILSFSQPGTPLYFFFMDRDTMYLNSYLTEGHHQDLWYTILHAKTEWLAKGILVAVLIYFILQKIVVKSRRKLMISLLVAAAFIFVPNFLISLTSQYIGWGRWENYYVYSFYSYLGFASLIALLFIYLVSLINNQFLRVAYCSLIALLFFIVTVANDYINFHVTYSIHKAERCNMALHSLMQSKEFRAIPNHSIIAAPDLMQQYTDVFYFYWNEKTLREYVLINSGKDLVFRKNTDSAAYYIGYTQLDKSESHYLTLSKITKLADSLVVSNDKMIVFTWPVCNSYHLRLSKLDSGAVYINGKAYEAHTSFYLKNKTKDITKQVIYLQSKGLLPEEVLLLPTPYAKGIKVEIE